MSSCVVATAALLQTGAWSGLEERVVDRDGDRHPDDPRDDADCERDRGEPLVAAAHAERDQGDITAAGIRRTGR